MDKIEKYAVENYIPIIRPKSLEILKETILLLKPKNVLEIGTAIGYSGINILQSCSAHLTTVELNENSFNVAKQNFERMGLLNRVTMYNMDAFDLLLELEKHQQKFEFIFLDGPKGQYVKYLPILERLLTDGGIIFADNVLFKGMVNSKEYPPHKYRTIVVNLRKYLQEVSKPPFVTQLLEVEDGIAISTKRGK